MEKTSPSKLARVRELIAHGATNRQIRAKVRIADRTIRKLGATDHKPRKSAHRCSCGGLLVTSTCLRCQLIGGEKGAA